MTNSEEIKQKAEESRRRALAVLDETGICEVWRAAGSRVNLVGSLRMGLIAKHRDIDLHVYSKNITIEDSFAIAARIVASPRITEAKCINGLHTDERCVAWHFYYRADDGELWQIDVIHIEEGSQYDGFFEKMADRINAVVTDSQRETILRLKFETPDDRDFHGVDYYEAVIADGVTTFEELCRWVAAKRQTPPKYWMP